MGRAGRGLGPAGRHPHGWRRGGRLRGSLYACQVPVPTSASTNWADWPPGWMAIRRGQPRGGHRWWRTRRHGQVGLDPARLHGQPEAAQQASHHSIVFRQPLTRMSLLRKASGGHLWWSPPGCWSPGPTTAGSAPRPPSPCSPASPPCRPAPGRSSATASTAAATGPQPRVAPGRAVPHGPRPRNQGLHRPPAGRRPDQARDPALRQAPPRPPPVRTMQALPERT